MILIFDLKTGNLSSIKKALDYLNIINEISDNPNDLEKSSKIICQALDRLIILWKNLNNK